MYRRQDDPSRFMFLQRWTSLEAHKENMATNVVASGHMAKIDPLLAGPIDNGVVEVS
jgi:quinol monooxygenase YgiN